MKQATALVVGLGLALGLGCARPEVNADPSYQDTTVQTPPIKPVMPPFMGQTLAVVPFVNKTLSEYEALGDIAPDILSEFVIAGGWRAVEGHGGQLDEVERELSFGQTDFVDPGSAARIGNMLGARYVLIGAVTNFRITTARGRRGVDVLGLVEVGRQTQTLEYDCQVSARIVDVETREILGVRTVSVKQRHEVGGSKTNVLGVRVDSGETVQVERDSLGVVLKLAFAQALNGIHDQVNMRAGMMQQQQYQQQQYQQPQGQQQYQQPQGQQHPQGAPPQYNPDPQ